MIRNNRFVVKVLVAAFICIGVIARPAPAYAIVEADAFSAGEPGDPQQSARLVDVTMRDAGGELVFDPNLVKVKLGEQIRFVVTNAGQLEHEFFLGSSDEISEHEASMKTMPDMERNDVNLIRLKPGETKELIWHFTKPSDFEYACLLPGHLEAGMLGKVVVE